MGVIAWINGVIYPRVPDFDGGPKMNERIAVAAGRLLLIVLWAAAWELTAVSGALPRGLIGQPSVFLVDFVELLADGTFPTAALITLEAVFIAFCAWRRAGACDRSADDRGAGGRAARFAHYRMP